MEPVHKELSKYKPCEEKSLKDAEKQSSFSKGN